MTETLGSGRITLLDRVFLTDVPDAGQLILVRHGQQAFPGSGWENVDGWVDPPLSKLGARQAEAVSAYLGTAPLKAVYSSGKQRADATASVIASRHGFDVEVEPAFRELHLFRDLPAGQRNPAAVYGLERMRTAEEKFVTSRRFTGYPGSETGKELRARVVTAVEAVLATHPAQVVVVACHTGVINAYLGYILGIDEDMFFRPAHASIQRVAFAGSRRVVITLNEVAHLQADLLTH